ncbi:MAG: glycoside hydrolase family 25 protein [Lachnospiraceae bacterium]|nr:glycoside hydrolase family 25 protein [Lachnospiraceae bacterium]
MAPNYYNQDNDDNRSYQKTVAMCVAAASLVILLFLVVLYVNSDSPKKTDAAKTESVKTEEEDDILEDSHNITSDELEFWKDEKKPTSAPVEEEEGELTPYKDPSAEEKEKETESSSSDKEKPKHDIETEGEGSLNRDNKEDTGDKEGYIAIEDEKGSKKYYEIISDVPKNDYDLGESLTNENGFLTYKDSKRESVRGVDLSKYNGTVDFTKLKENGIGFAMLRLGSRGYGTGNITLDEKFVEYAQNAQLSGIQIGAYFYSQAINESEAVEEANYIVGAVSSFNVKYPIAIDIERVKGDEARTDKLTSEERTKVVKTFCDAVKGYGYKPIIYATKEMLVAGLDLGDLADYDIWLADENVPTDFPYRFSMWQYSTKGRIDGITGDIDFDISFIDYEKR